MPARKISEILGAESALGDLAAASRRVERLQRIYLEAVPAVLSRMSRVGWARAGVVSVIASNGAVAAKLRQMTPRILEGFRRHGLKFNSMRIEVQVDAGQPAPAARGAKRLSPEALRSLEESLRTLPESPLRAALARLARRRGDD
jgi:hypothetical protein